MWPRQSPCLCAINFVRFLPELLLPLINNIYLYALLLSSFFALSFLPLLTFSSAEPSSSSSLSTALYWPIYFLPFFHSLLFFLSASFPPTMTITTTTITTRSCVSPYHHHHHYHFHHLHHHPSPPLNRLHLWRLVVLYTESITNHRTVSQMALNFLPSFSLNPFLSTQQKLPGPWISIWLIFPTVWTSSLLFLFVCGNPLTSLVRLLFASSLWDPNL